MTLVSKTSEVESGPSIVTEETGQATVHSIRWPKKIFVALLKCCAACLSLAMICTVLERWIPNIDPLIQFRFQNMSLLLLCGFVLWRVKQAGWALLCVLVALPTAWTAASLYLPSANRLEIVDLTDAPMRKILTINLLHRNPEIKLVAPHIEEEDPDVICFIEVTQRWVKYFEYLDAEYKYVAIDPSFQGKDVRVYSKFPLHEYAPEMSPSMTGAAIVRAEVEFPERTVSLLVSHPNSPTTSNRIFFRNLQLDELAEHVNNEFPRPVICCGDFNTTTWSVNLLDFVRDTGLKDSRQGFGLQPSWPSYAYAFPARITIDHVFVSDEIVVERRHLGPYVGSDHLPVILEFKLKREK